MNVLPLVSVVIPSYNCAKTIIKAVDSIFSQDYPADKLEVIVVDDGSSDNTKEVLGAFRNKPNFRFIQKPHSGPADTRNYGWQAAGAEIVFFMDADCVANKDLLSKLIPGFNQPQVGAVTGSYGIIPGQGFLPNCIYQEILLRHQRMPEFCRSFGSFNVAIKKEVLLKIGGFKTEFKEASAEDNELSYSLLKEGYRIRRVNSAKVLHYFPQKLICYLVIQFRHGFWRALLYKMHPQMVFGDDYTQAKDIIELVLIFVMLALALFSFFYSFLGIFSILVLGIYLVIQIPLALQIALNQKDIRYLVLGGVTFLRGFARFLGLAKGWVYFYLKDKLPLKKC